jgi:hypothetical protein
VLLCDQRDDHADIAVLKADTTRWKPSERHQLCWGHLIRNFQALVDRWLNARRPWSK